MKNLDNLSEYFNESPLSFIKTLPAKNLHFDDRAYYMCKYGCKNYNRKYSCPPESVQLSEVIKKRQYTYALIFATTHKIPKGLSRYRIRFLNNQKEMEIQRMCYQISNILNMSSIKHIMLSGGSCKKCKECSFSIGEPCKKPKLKQTSMEAVGIDCQATMHDAGFDFAMPNIGSINRCGCVLSNDKRLSGIYAKKRESLQKFTRPTKKRAIEMIKRLMKEYPELFKSIKIFPMSNLKLNNNQCTTCTRNMNNYSCPPYSNTINLTLWKYYIVWEWNKNTLKKNSYNIALKTIHGAMFSIGNYFALSLRDCYCDECNPCTYNSSGELICKSRKILSPSMQSQGIQPPQFGEGKYGIELI